MTDTLSMSALAQTSSEPSVLVDRDKLQAVSDAINDGIQHDMPWELLLVGIGATLSTIVLVSLRRWWLNRHQSPSPTVLFNAIARKAGLGWRDRFLLYRIARSSHLPNPITLLLARGTLRHYSDIYLSSRVSSTSRRVHQRIARIEAELFG